jgi:hypothetical protein
MSRPFPTGTSSAAATSPPSGGPAGAPAASAVAALKTKIDFSTYIRGLVEQTGTEIFDEPNRFRAFLMDQFPFERREIRALHLAAEDGIAASLARASENDIDIEKKRQLRRFEDQLGVAPALAEWTVEVLALALRKSVAIPAEPPPEQRPVEPAPSPPPPDSLTKEEPIRPDDGSSSSPAQKGAAQPASWHAVPPDDQSKFKMWAPVGLVLAAIVALFTLSRSPQVSAPAPPPSTTSPRSQPYYAPAPPLQLVPDGTHIGRRGWTERAPGTPASACQSEYPSFDVTVRGTSISFYSDGDWWSGSIDQQLGQVRIYQEKNANLSIIGYYAFAVMSGGARCKTGFFTLDLRR